MSKIIHIDMDCFYAAIEERDDPSLRGKPVGVAGKARRSVLTTANYEARKYGCRSAMPVFKALELCPHLVLVPVRFDHYRGESARIRAIFGRFTDLIEPLSLDEAFLDVSHLQSAAASVAREIRAQIFEETGLTASAGISTNKMIAKIASDWHKPNGQFEVTAAEIPAFIAALPVSRLWGVGRKMSEKLAALGVTTCAELQRFDQLELSRRFGKWGLELWELCRGIDARPVTPDRTRKSLSSEMTFAEIKVGTPGVRRSPRRSRRAELPHRAPQECAQVESRSSLGLAGRTESCGARLALASEFRRGLFDDPRCRQLPAVPGGIELRPVEAFALAAPVEPFENQPPHMVGVGAGLLRIADHTVVVPVTLQFAPEGGQDDPERQAPSFL
jgi:DNA polymerase-4